MKPGIYLSLAYRDARGTGCPMPALAADLLAGHLAALGRGEADRRRSDALLAASKRMVRARVGLQ